MICLYKDGVFVSTFTSQRTLNCFILGWHFAKYGGHLDNSKGESIEQVMTKNGFLAKEVL